MPAVPQAGTEEVAEALAAWAARFDARLDEVLSPTGACWPELAEAMRYTALLPGKRLRPFLVVRCCEVCGGQADQAMPAAVAVELVHCFTLIHDDLPAMDDDDLRRGKPANHKVFGEAMAILAGDGLLALAFELLATRATDAAVAAGWVGELAAAVGWEGTMSGQAADIRGERLPPDRALTERIHRQKTARLFQSACRLGAIAARADERQFAALGAYGLDLGLAFQIADDLLDVRGQASDMGKQMGKDAASNKQTYPVVVGNEESLRLADQAAERAVSALKDFGSEADDLRRLARFVPARRR